MPPRLASRAIRQSQGKPGARAGARRPEEPYEAAGPGRRVTVTVSSNPPSRPRAATRASRKRVGGGELIQQLNDMVAELIRENRKLRREVEKLTARGSAAASSAVERSLRTMQRRVEKALAGPGKGRRKTAGAKATRRKTVTTKRRKSR
jgi:hypothetical protein